MASINQFVVIGNLTKDAELRSTPNGTPVAVYTVAVNNIYRDADGKQVEQVDFIPVTVYGKQAESDVKYLKKGAEVAVSGRIRSWYKPDQKRGGFNFVSLTVQYLRKPNKNKEASVDMAEHQEWLEDYAGVSTSQAVGDLSDSDMKKV